MCPRAGRAARRGANAIEFALTLPILFAVVSSLVDFGYRFAIWYAASSAVNVGARTGSFVAAPADPSAPAVAAAEVWWAGLGLSAAPEFTATVEGDPPTLVVQAEVGPVGLVGLLPSSTFHVTAVRRLEER